MLHMLALCMVSLPTSLARHLLVETSGNQRGDDYTWKGPPPISPNYSISSEGHKKNYKEELIKITDEMKRQGKDYGGFTDFLKETVELVKPAWKVVGPALQKGFNAVMDQLNKGELFMIPNIPSQSTVETFFDLIMTSKTYDM